MLISVSSRFPRSTRRAAGFAAAAALGLAVLSGCSNDNVACGLDSCTVTLDRSVNASANVLGVEAKFVSAEGENVVVEVAGEQLTLSVGQTATQVAGLNVSLESINADNVKVLVAR